MCYRFYPVILYQFSVYMFYRAHLDQDVISISIWIIYHRIQ